MDNTQPISLTAPENQPQINILAPQTNYGPTPPTPDIAAQRATKAHLGIHDFPMDQKTMEGQILLGNEGKIRTAAAAHVDNQRSLYREGVIDRFVAAKNGAPLNDIEKESVNELLRQKLESDPKTVFEENYPIAFFENLRNHAETNPNTPWNDLDPKQKEEALIGGRTLMQKDQIAQTLTEALEQRAKSQGYPAWMADRAKEWLIPGYTDYKLRDKLFALQTRGTNLEEQMKNGYSLPPEQFKIWFAQNIQQREQDNPALAVEWAHAMRGMSSSEKGMMDLLTFADFLAPPIGGGTAVKLIKAGVSSFIAKDMVTSALKTSFKEPASSAAMHEAAGDLGNAAAAGAAKDAIERTTGKVSPIKDLLDNLPGMFNSTIDAVKNFPGRLRREAQERIIQDETRAGQSIVEGAKSLIKIDRVPVLQAGERFARQILDKFADDYPEIKNNLLNNTFRPTPLGRDIVWYLGKTGTELFGNRKKAQDFIKYHKLEGLNPVIDPQGAGFAVEISKPMAENTYARDVLMATGETHTPDNWLNSVVGFLRSPEYTLSTAQAVARKIATYGESVYRKMASEALKDMNKLKPWFGSFQPERKKKWLQFQQVLDDLQTQGKTFNTAEELDQHYMKSIGRLPDDQEVFAAYSWRRGWEMEKTWKNFQAMKEDARLGGQTITLTLPSGETTKAFTGLKDFKFRGIKLPPDTANKSGPVVITGRLLGEESFANLQSLPASIKGKVQSGELKLYQILNHVQEQPLAGMSKKMEDVYPKYVITENGKESSLEWNMYSRSNPQYNYNHAVKQAIVKYDPISGTHSYVGDATISVHGVRGEATNVAKSLDTIRQFFKDKNPDGAKAFLERSGLPHEWAEVQSWFKPTITRQANGQFMSTPSKYSVDYPIKAVPKGKMLMDIDNSIKNVVASKGSAANFKNEAEYGTSRYLGVQYDPQDVFALKNKGTASRPDYDKVPVQHINPITTLNRALNRVINAQFINDYRHFSIEHWIQEAKKHDILNVTPQQLAASPEYYFHKADAYYKNVTGDKLRTKNNLQLANTQIKQFIGVGDPFGNLLHSMSQKLSDSLYAADKPKMALVAEHLIPRLTDPQSFVRNMTFHAKLGLFNPAQLMVQAQSFATIFGIAGSKYAAPGTKAALLYQWASKVNRSPEILDHLDKLATRQIIPGTSRWKPGQWKEAMNFGEESGFLNVGNEYALRDSMARQSFITSGGRKFLDWGTFFFTEGERSVRQGAWFTAFKEFVDKNPTAALRERELGQILQRADLLYSNMSKASNSVIQKGWFSIPTQFLSYQLRTAEMFLSHKLTDLERARLFGTYAAFYGVPGALGLFGIPFGDYIRKWALEDNYNVGDNWAHTAVMDGVPSLMLGLATGNYYNIQERYGIQGFDPIRAALAGDKTTWDLLTGATGQMAGNLFWGSAGPGSGSMHPFFKAMTDLFHEKGEFEFRHEDLLEPFKEIATVNTVFKTLYAFNTGRIITKKEVPIDMQASPMNIIFQAVTGLADQGLVDSYIKFKLEKEEKALQNYGMDKAVQEIRRGAIAAQNDDPEEAQSRFRRARSWLQGSGVPDNLYGGVFARAFQQTYQTIIDASKYQWAYGRKTPPARQQEQLERQQGNQ